MHNCIEPGHYEILKKELKKSFVKSELPNKQTNFKYNIMVFIDYQN